MAEVESLPDGPIEGTWFSPQGVKMEVTRDETSGSPVWRVTVFLFARGGKMGEKEFSDPTELHTHLRKLEQEQGFAWAEPGAQPPPLPAGQRLGVGMLIAGAVLVLIVFLLLKAS